MHVVTRQMYTTCIYLPLQSHATFRLWKSVAGKTGSQDPGVRIRLRGVHKQNEISEVHQDPPSVQTAAEAAQGSVDQSQSKTARTRDENNIKTIFSATVAVIDRLFASIAVKMLTMFIHDGSGIVFCDRFTNVKIHTVSEKKMIENQKRFAAHQNCFKTFLSSQ